MIRNRPFLNLAIALLAILPMSSALAQGDTTIVVCGAAPILPTYCYVASDAQSWNYESSSTGTMRLRFLQGTIESATYDHLRIYDGVDATGTLLYDHIGAAVNLGPVGSGVNTSTTIFDAVEVYASGSSLYMEMSSDGSVQCQGSTTYDQWEWEVVCLDCTIPQASYAIIDDCANSQFSISVDVMSTGDGGVVNIVYIVNGGAAQTASNVGVGVTELGPFTQNDTVNVVVEHENNFLCNVAFGDLTDTGTCPELIDCGTQWVDSLCYGNNMDMRYYYQGTGTSPLAIFFDQGIIAAGDTVIVYDGADISAPRLFTSSGLTDLSTRLFITTNPEQRLTLRFRSNTGTSCATNTVQVPSIWRIGCYDCSPATATFTLVQDCANAQFSIDVAISDLGSATLLEIINTANSDTVMVSATGTTTVGPFPADTAVAVTILNLENDLCNVYGSALVNPLCPDPVPCPGTGLEETYCYVANDRHVWAYELQGGPGNLRLTFDRGTIESATFDRIYIFDGPDNQSPILWSNDDLYPPVGGDSTGFPQQATGNLGPVGSAVLSTSTNFFGAEVVATGSNLYMENYTDGSVQCSTSTTYDPWEWRVYCVDCDNPQATVTLIPDCPNRTYNAEVTVTEVGGTADLSITNLSTGDTLSDVGVGVHQFGPFPIDSLSLIRVYNQEYPQCRYNSAAITYSSDSCIVVSCGVDQYNYCYGNDEDRWYTYKSAMNVPLSIRFSGGILLAGDLITIYDGRDATGNVLFQGNNNSASLANLSVNTSAANTGHYLTLRIRSNGSGSCETGESTEPMAWAVGCGVVGIAEIAERSFTVFPNPTEGLLQIELGSKVEGKVQLRVSDMSGRIILDEQLRMNGGTRNAVDLSKFQSGQYLVQVTTPNWVSTERVQIAR